MHTMYAKLGLHIDRHQYKRGAHKGDAPLDSSRRSRSHERVATREGHRAVRFYSTDVLRAYPDGTITIDCASWGRSPTTRNFINDALRWFGNNIGYLYSDRLHGKTQLVLKTNQGRFAYHDGIKIDAEGRLLTEPKPFMAKRVDKDATKELYADMQECGFKDVFKLLHAVAERQGPAETSLVRSTVFHADSANLREYVTMDLHANKWPYVVELVSFQYEYDWKTRQAEYIKLEYKTAWARLMQRLKRDLYKTVSVEVDSNQ